MVYFELDGGVKAVIMRGTTNGMRMIKRLKPPTKYLIYAFATIPLLMYLNYHMMKVGYKHKETTIVEIAAMKTAVMKTGAIEPPSNDVEQRIINEFKKLSQGQIELEFPKKMKVGVEQKIIARVSKHYKADLAKSLEGIGINKEKKIALLVGNFMKVQLKGDNFEIEALSPEDQIVVTDRDTEWDRVICIV